MKDEYLWDKSGSDAEIEGLENTLSRFRYAAIDPPELPATNIIKFAKTPQRRWFAYFFAAAGCLTLVMLVGVWLRSGETGNNVTSTVAIVAPVVNRDMTPKSKVPVSKLANEPKPALTTLTSTPKSFRSRAIRAKPRLQRQQMPLVLTAEEKYAYGQLMLALSITGSKLRMVREMVDGSDDKAPIVDK
jgi:hypothetical protein